MKKYVEVTIALDDAAPDTIEVFHRSKEDEGAWSEPEVTECSLHCYLNFPWLKLEIGEK